MPGTGNLSCEFGVSKFTQVFEINQFIN